MRYEIREQRSLDSRAITYRWRLYTIRFNALNERVSVEVSRHRTEAAAKKRLAAITAK